MHLRLDDAVLTMPPTVLYVYLHLEKIASGRDVIDIQISDIGRSRSPRHIRRAFPYLRRCGLSIDWHSSTHTWRVAWPNSVDLAALRDHLHTLDAGVAYNINLDTLRNVRSAFPNLDAGLFQNALESALISAHMSAVKSGNLIRWLKHGILQESRHNADTSTAQTNRPSNQLNQQGDDTWREKAERAAAARPDLKKLYGPQSQGL